MASWSHKRQLMFLSIPLAFVLAISAFFYAKYIYTPASCFNGVKDGSEAGTDCGGSCALICSGDSLEPVTLWAKAFSVTGDVYNVVAYVQNPNIKSEVYSAGYTFKVYDDLGNVIYQRKGQTHIPKNKKFAVFEGGLKIPGSNVKKVDLEWQPLLWYKSNLPEPELVVTNQPIENQDTSPKIKGSVLNNTLNSIGPLELISIVYDARGNAIGSSRTIIEKIKKDQSEYFVFTWPKAFQTGEEACEVPSSVMMVLDRSGSMASISKNPPEPLNSVKKTAKDFISNLKFGDVAGMVSFATLATNPVDHTLTFDLTAVKDAIENIVISTSTTDQNTNIGDAIDRATDELLSERNEGGLKKVLILLTDGEPTDPKKKGDDSYPSSYALEASRKAKDKGIVLYTIGLGSKVNTNLLIDIAGSKEKYFASPTIDALSSIYKKIAESICTIKPNVIEIIPNLIYR
jgi:Mg-chelatase subunit ChlD